MYHSISLKTYHWALLILALLSLSACGFQPRGQANKPAPHLSPLLVTGLATHHPFYRELSHQLELAGVTLTTDSESASSLLKIHKQKTRHRVLSVNSRSKTVETEIEESLEYSFQLPPGTTLGEPRFIGTNRILFDPGTQTLGRDREETLLQADMYKQLSRLLINQLAAIR